MNKTQKKLVDKKQIMFFSMLCFMVYYTSYITRINYGAVIAEIVTAEGILKSAASVVITAGFISYGVGQLVSGYLGDKLNPKKMIFWGLLATSICNFIMPFCGSVGLMILVWTFNGFAQAMMWPPLVKIMSGYLTKENYQKTTVTVSIASSFGTISVYLIAPVLIYLSGWRTIFFFSGAIGVLIAFLWVFGLEKLDSLGQETDETEVQIVTASIRKNDIPFRDMIIPSGLIFIILGIILQGVLRDGITTWMPSYILETFHLDSSISILSAVVLPVFSIISFKLASYLQRHVFTNILTSATVMFFAGFLAIVVMMLFYSSSVWLSILLSGLITGCMHGVNLMLVCLVPGCFDKQGNVSWVSGMLNFFTYVGSALSTYGVAKISELYGWQNTVLSWAIIALLGTSACFICIKRWARFSQQ